MRRTLRQLAINLRFLLILYGFLHRAPPTAAVASPVTTPELVATDVGGFCWVNGIRQHYPIKSHETVAIALTAAFSAAGTYNMASLDVSVLTDDGRLSHELLCPSLMVVQQPRTP